jgi:hypothetical protein
MKELFHPKLYPVNPAAGPAKPWRRWINPVKKMNLQNKANSPNFQIKNRVYRKNKPKFQFLSSWVPGFLSSWSFLQNKANFRIFNRKTNFENRQLPKQTHFSSGISSLVAGLFYKTNPIYSLCGDVV